MSDDRRRQTGQKLNEPNKPNLTRIARIFFVFFRSSVRRHRSVLSLRPKHCQTPKKTYFYINRLIIEEATIFSKITKEKIEQWEKGKKVYNLIKTLKHKDYTLRMAAASALGNLGDTRAVQPLIEALEDKYWNVKASAASALGNLGDIRAVRPLIKALGEDEYAFARLAAASALSKLGEKKWLNIVKGENEDYQRLGNSGDKRAVEPLTRALSDKDFNVRRNAASALGNLGDKSAIEPLIKAYENDNDKNVKTAIVNAVKKLQGK